MAPPPSRRPGFSRRAQYGLFLGYVTAVAGIMFALLLLVVAAIDPRGFAALRGAGLDATAPISEGGRSVVGFFTGAGDAFSNYFMAGAQNGRLRKELQGSRREVMEARAILLENRRLKSMLRLAELTPDEVAIGRIVGSSFDSPRRLATLSVGTASGVRAGQPVRAPEGLLGRVLETGRSASRVLLVTDAASNVPVRLVRNGMPAIASGRGDGFLDLKPLEVGGVRLRRGDLFVTSGVGGIFPPNIPVAVVASVRRDDTIGRPLANPAGADFALVQTMFQPAAAAPQEPAQ